MESSSRLHDVDYNSLSSVETNTYHNSFQSHQQRKQQQHRIRFDSDLRSDSDSDYGGPISIPITAARSRLRRPNSDSGPDRSIEALNRFAIPDSDSRSRVSVPSNDQDSDYGGPIPFSVSGPIDLAIRVSLSKQSINTYQSSPPKHRSSSSRSTTACYQ